VHRDIKPSNILFGGDGQARLADFGLAQTLESSRLPGSRASHPGTAAYMSPEQESSNGYLTAGSDIYALGIVGFEMVTGARYRDQRPDTPARAISTQVPLWLDSVLLKALQKDPWARFRTASEMSDSLKAGLSGTREQRVGSCSAEQVDRLNNGSEPDRRGTTNTVSPADRDTPAWSFPRQVRLPGWLWVAVLALGLSLAIASLVGPAWGTYQPPTPLSWPWEKPKPAPPAQLVSGLERDAPGGFLLVIALTHLVAAISVQLARKPKVHWWVTLSMALCWLTYIVAEQVLRVEELYHYEGVAMGQRAAAVLLMAALVQWLSSGLPLLVPLSKHRARSATQGLRSDSPQARFYLERAWALYQLNDWETALRDADEASQLQPQWAHSWLIRSLAEWHLPSVRTGVACANDADHAVELAPSWGYAHAVAAYARAPELSLDTAVTDDMRERATRALQLEPVCALAHAARARAYLGDSRLSEAMRDLQRALELDPQAAYTYRVRALAWDLLAEQASKGVEIRAYSTNAKRDRATAEWLTKRGRPV